MLNSRDLLRCAAAIRRDQRGTLAVWTAVTALPLVLSVGVAMDIQRAGRDHTQLKSALDAAVLAAVNNNAISDREREAFAEQAFRDNHSGAPIVSLQALAEDGGVSLEATVRTDLTLSSMVGLSELEVSARSKAYLNSPDVICALALNETEEGAVKFDDVISFDASTCSVQSNSNHPDAIVSTSTITPVAKNFCAHGGTSGVFTPSGTGECARVDDPYRDRVFPKPGKCRKSLDLSVRDISAVFRKPVKAAALPFDTGFDTSDAPEKTPRDLLQEAEKVLRALMGDNSSNLEDFRWETKKGKTQIHAKFNDEDDNPFGDSETHHIPEAEVSAFIRQHGTNPVPAEAQIEFDPSTELAQVTLTDGTPVVIDGDDSKNLVDSGAVLTPGTYCGGLTVAGTNVLLRPGVYHMLDGPFVVKDTAKVRGDGVGIVLAGHDARLKVETGGQLTLKAPRSDDMKGLVVAEDTSRPSRNVDGDVERLTSRIASGGRLSVTGTVYLPSHAVKVTGDDSGLGSHAPSTSFIADTLEFRGNGRVKISVDHREAGLPPVEPRSEDGARLVE